MGHASQERSLVLQIAYTQALQTRHTRTTNRSGSRVRTGSRRLTHQFSLVATGKAKLADIWDDDEGSSEDAFVSGLGTFDKLAAKNHVE